MALTIAVLVSACGRGGVPFLDGERPSTEVEVLDGATLRVDGEIVRLDGVSAPRTAPAARCWAEALLAREAMEALRARAVFVRDIQIVPTSADPSLARVLIDGRDLSRLLIDEGLAAPTGEGWDWCGPIALDARRAPRLGYPVEAAKPQEPLAAMEGKTQR